MLSDASLAAQFEFEIGFLCDSNEADIFDRDGTRDWATNGGFMTAIVRVYNRSHFDLRTL